MAVPSSIADLDSVASNNSPLGSEAIGTSLDDYLRAHAAIIKQVSNAGAKIASNLSDLASVATARTNLGLGTAALVNTGTSAGNAVVLDGSGKLPAVNGSQLTGIVTGGHVQGAFKNLQVSATGGNASVSVSYDEIVLEDGSNAYVTARSGTLTINSAATGANGLDTGTLAASTWYSVWVIRKPDGTTAGLISTSATAPTMPSGYTFKARIGWICTDGTANKYPLAFKQFGRRVSYVVASGTNVTKYPQLASGLQGNVSTPTFVAAAWAAFAPPTQCALHLSLVPGNAATAIAAPNNGFSGFNTLTNPPPMQAVTGVCNAVMVTESANVYYAANNAAGILMITGWDDNL